MQSPPNSIHFTCVSIRIFASELYSELWRLYRPSYFKLCCWHLQSIPNSVLFTWLSTFSVYLIPNYTPNYAVHIDLFNPNCAVDICTPLWDTTSTFTPKTALYTKLYHRILIQRNGNYDITRSTENFRDGYLNIYIFSNLLGLRRFDSEFTVISLSYPCGFHLIVRHCPSKKSNLFPWRIFFLSNSFHWNWEMWQQTTMAPARAPRRVS